VELYESMLKEEHTNNLNHGKTYHKPLKIWSLIMLHLRCSPFILFRCMDVWQVKKKTIQWPVFKIWKSTFDYGKTYHIPLRFWLIVNPIKEIKNWTKE